MTLRKFVAILNWRQVAIHFIATWFFMYSFQTFAVLHDTNLVEVARQPGKDSITKAIIENRISIDDLSYFTLWTGFAHTIGLLVAFGISLTIAIRRKWLWFNSFLVFILAFALSRRDLLGWAYLKVVLLTPGEVFRNVKLEFLTNGLILLTLGLVTFFLSAINKFIADGTRTTV